MKTLDSDAKQRILSKWTCQVQTKGVENIDLSHSYEEVGCINGRGTNKIKQNLELENQLRSDESESLSDDDSCSDQFVRKTAKPANKNEVQQNKIRTVNLGKKRSFKKAKNGEADRLKICDLDRLVPIEVESHILDQISESNHATEDLIKQIFNSNQQTSLKLKSEIDALSFQFTLNDDQSMSLNIANKQPKLF